MSTIEDNLEKLRAAVDATHEAGRAPLTFVDLDDTLNRSFGGLIEPAAVTALQGVAQAGALLGVNTGADIVWAGERILCATERHFSFPFMLLATGTQIDADLGMGELAAGVCQAADARRRHGCGNADAGGLP